MSRSRDMEDGELSDESPKSGQFGDNEDFIIDKSFSGVVLDEDHGSESVPIPDDKQPSAWQKQMRKRLLAEQGPVEDEPKKRRRLNCFNCLGEHNIANCTEPKDFARIRKNKAEFMDAQKPSARISNNVESQSQFKPGRLSHKLRSALNLGPDDIPEWVYRMRRMGFHKGYPPGHLKNALRKEYSTIKIFSDDKSKEVEEYETPTPSPTVDLNKIHYYMGFNKTYGALRDFERGRFEVPPFDVFCDMLQSGVAKEHNTSETIRIYEERTRREKREMMKAMGGESAVDRNETEESDEVKEAEAERRTPTPPKEAEDGFLPGESISQFVGTPVISRRDQSGVWVEDSVPPLEAFAVGIVPFEAKEEEQSRGIFKKIMSTLRKKSDET